MAKLKTRVFYSKGKILTTIMLMKKNHEGEPLYQKYQNGTDKYDKRGEQVPVMFPIKFVPELINISKETRGMYRTTDVNVIQQLDILDLDPDSNVITKERLDKEKNPTAFELKGQVNKLTQENQELLSKLGSKK